MYTTCSHEQYLYEHLRVVRWSHFLVRFLCRLWVWCWLLWCVGVTVAFSHVGLWTLSETRHAVKVLVPMSDL